MWNLTKGTIKNIICREANCSLNMDHDDDDDDDDNNVLAFLYKQKERNCSL